MFKWILPTDALIELPKKAKKEDPSFPINLLEGRSSHETAMSISAKGALFR